MAKGKHNLDCAVKHMAPKSAWGWNRILLDSRFKKKISYLLMHQCIWKSFCWMRFFNKREYLLPIAAVFYNSWIGIIGYTTEKYSSQHVCYSVVPCNFLSNKTFWLCFVHYSILLSLTICQHIKFSPARSASHLSWTNGLATGRKHINCYC